MKRLIGRRDEYELDMEALLRAAAESGCAVEINANPDRLDMSWQDARQAFGKVLVAAPDNPKAKLYVERCDTELASSKALDDAAVQARYVELGSAAPNSAERGPAALQKLVESEVARITPIIKAAGVTAE